MTIEREHDEAWRVLRSRLADHLASMEPEEEVGLAVDDGSGEVPAYVVVAVVVDVEAGGRLLLEAVGVGGLVEPWAPGDEYEDDDPVFHAELAQRECDLAAALVVGALRDQHGCLHPAFLLSRELDLGGLRWESRARALPPRGATVLGDDAPLAVLVEDRDHLQRMVDATLAEMLDQPIAHDEDGDVPVPVGESVVWVQVLPDRPSVALFAILVDDVADTDAAAREVSGLQARLPYLQVRATADSIVVRHEICAVPFAPRQLAGVLARLCSEIDDIAGEVAERVGGRRFLAGLGDEGEPAADEPLPGGLDEHLATVVELLLDGQVEPAQVAAAYDGQRTLLVRSLVGLRTGTVVVPGVDLDLLLHTVRSGLRHLVDRAARRDEGPTRPRGPRSQQLSLLPEDEPGLDLPGSERWVG